jgi:2-methylisocitrate lyase-like PEP mutase family enzyme
MRIAGPSDDVRARVSAKTFIGVGVHDGLSICLADGFPFDFLWLGSFGISASMGIPDVGLVDLQHPPTVSRMSRNLSSKLIFVDLASESP